MGAKRIAKDMIPERDRQVAAWLAAGHAITDIQQRHRKKYKVGISFGVVKAIQKLTKGNGRYAHLMREVEPEQPPTPAPEDGAMILTSPSGLVPARDVSDRLRALIGHVADAMGKEGVIEVVIQDREVVVSFSPDQQLFEV